ncbi:uncharacterized protein DUF2559 [Tamilnaduibacter salinus]|uniref:DUF2559 domain-containing protein n=1 Tax=Tamilnaduibacter salinus TaxID=1484056 RepID=A0A2A2I016_9GAMM|nr:YhfG family protein [Tamilnaduibacter salinus]PAV24485.1 DUF2559 domain-containing protein [Tamilnaduibacter salinus]PVY76857.1 uncharacterized protein DUF2559 [Tamilnaduibacter salinus]
MASSSLEAKRAYFAKTRRANYAASLRLEGFDVKSGDVKYASRRAAVRAHRKRATANA